MFIKHGDGKIVSVLDEESLSEEQKKALKNMNKQVVKQSETDTSANQQKKSGG